MTQPILTHDVVRGERGWRYRLWEGDQVVLTSGEFLLREDAHRCGAHFAADEATIHFIRENVHAQHRP